ncbi:uncharacterized protein si:dkeyp-117h8.4 isoform X2 [Trichomycterus rosablanca]|uniref:uncharacterized protein si:dkeyp-117h8.4 isoform X2 n=1 Tax=Trichomycterus rosablanca TaxID=2290929 RepID=UPI002F35A329
MELNWRKHGDYNDENRVLQQFKKNDEVFRNKMEMIFQKYSNLDDAESDVCLKTMTLRTGKGIMSINSTEAEHELRNLRNHVEHEQSLRVVDTSRDEHSNSEHDMSLCPSANQTDITYRSESEDSRRVEKDDILWQGAETSQLSMHSVNSSRGYFFDNPSQEEDEDLERTLSSHGSTLLDVYPSMLNQIRESYRRQHVTKAATAVLRRYRHHRWQSSKGKHRNSNLSNSPDHSFNKSRDSAPKRFHTNQTVSQGSPLHKGRHQNDTKSIRNASPVSSGCFYSPRRDDAEKHTDAESRSHWTGLHSHSKTKHQPVSVLDLSSLPSSDSSSSHFPSPDLNQTYTVGPDVMPGSQSVLSSDACMSTWSGCKPGTKGLPHYGQEAEKPILAYQNPKISSPGCQGAKGLLLACQRAKSSPLAYRGVKIVSHQGDRLVMPLASYKQSSSEREGLREHIYSPASSSRETFTGSPSSLRSPLKPKVLSPYPEYQRSSPNYPKQISLTNPRSSSVVNRSPFHNLPTSPSYSRHPFSPHQENLPMSLAQKRQRSLSSQQARFFDVSKMSSSQIDAEFTKLYHHFVCRGSSSSGPKSSCHICRVERAAQNPGMSSSSMSALALTPVRTKLMKRRRQPEVEESLRSKRFRESCSPHRPKQQANTNMNRAMAEPSEDQRTWNRALLLQCPSPRFLRASGGIRKAPGPKLDQQTQQTSPFWRAPWGCADTSAARSTMRTSNHSDALLSPSLSRRRLQYGPPQ